MKRFLGVAVGVEYEFTSQDYYRMKGDSVFPRVWKNDVFPRLKPDEKETGLILRLSRFSLGDRFLDNYIRSASDREDFFK